ncbi:MAG: hypothetical protein GY803_04070 [Chloroflexi bacterium]|nr:hypothetical protein [Chloroflexota bacterium]
MPLNLWQHNPKDEAFHAFRFIFACQPLSFDLVSDGNVNDEEVIEPRWYDIEGLTADQFQSFGDVIVDYLNGSMAGDRGQRERPFLPHLPSPESRHLPDK